MAAILQTTFFKYIFLNENFGILIKLSLKFVAKNPVRNISPLVQVMACRQIGNKPLPEPMGDPDPWCHKSLLGHNELSTIHDMSRCAI